MRQIHITTHKNTHSYTHRIPKANQKAKTRQVKDFYSRTSLSKSDNISTRLNNFHWDGICYSETSCTNNNKKHFPFQNLKASRLPTLKKTHSWWSGTTGTTMTTLCSMCPGVPRRSLPSPKGTSTPSPHRRRILWCVWLPSKLMPPASTPALMTPITQGTQVSIQHTVAS